MLSALRSDKLEDHDIQHLPVVGVSDSITFTVRGIAVLFYRIRLCHTCILRRMSIIHPRLLLFTDIL